MTVTKPLKSIFKIILIGNNKNKCQSLDSKKLTKNIIITKCYEGHIKIFYEINSIIDQ